ncbi:unnamed protein product, partial [Ectocarpus sp. 8 AP-2014]
GRRPGCCFGDGYADPRCWGYPRPTRKRDRAPQPVPRLSRRRHPSSAGCARTRGGLGRASWFPEQRRRCWWRKEGGGRLRHVSGRPPIIVIFTWSSSSCNRRRPGTRGRVKDTKSLYLLCGSGGEECPPRGGG